MSDYEERAAHVLSTAGSSMPAALKGIGWALLALRETGKTASGDHGAQTCKFCGDTYGDMGQHLIVNLKGCGDKLARMIIPAGGTP
jgi:hypothetical protein